MLTIVSSVIMKVLGQYAEHRSPYLIVLNLGLDPLFYKNKNAPFYLRGVDGCIAAEAVFVLRIPACEGRVGGIVLTFRRTRIA